MEINPDDKIMVSCVLYKYIQNILQSSNDQYKNTANELVTSYITHIYDKIMTLKERFISYELMKNAISNINKKNFFQYTDDDVNTIYDLYLNKTKIENFSIYSFKQAMYKIQNLSHKEYLKLSKIHKNIMIPICLYYINKYSISDEDLKIYSVKRYESDDIGSEIIFYIKNIPSSKIVSDIKNRNITIDFKSIKVYGDYVSLML